MPKADMIFFNARAHTGQTKTADHLNPTADTVRLSAKNTYAWNHR